MSGISQVFNNRSRIKITESPTEEGPEKAKKMKQPLTSRGYNLHRLQKVHMLRAEGELQNEPWKSSETRTHEGLSQKAAFS